MRSRSAAAQTARVAAGVALGVALGFWLASLRRPARSEADDEPLDEVLGWADRWGDRMDAAVDVAAVGLRAIERRWASAPVLDPVVVQAALDRVPGSADLRAEVLGRGLVDLEGRATDAVADEARRALQALDGVEVVVNRIWTPSSTLPAAN